jgi:hypothetical protein
MSKKRRGGHVGKGVIFVCAYDRRTGIKRRRGIADGDNERLCRVG